MEILDFIITLLIGNSTATFNGQEYIIQGAFLQALAVVGAFSQGISSSRKAKKVAKAQEQQAITQNNLAVADSRRDLQKEAELQSVEDFNRAVSGLKARSEAQLQLSEKGIQGGSADSVINDFYKNELNERLLSKLEFENLLNEQKLQQENQASILNQNLKNIRASKPTAFGTFANVFGNIVETGVFGGKK